MLKYAGYDVKTIVHTNNVFPVIEQYTPDLILIDYILSGINDGEICHQIKTKTDTSQIPVIIISGHSRVLKSLGNYGCDVFIEKPFELADLLKDVAECITKNAGRNKSLSVL